MFREKTQQLDEKTLGRKELDEKPFGRQDHQVVDILTTDFTLTSEITFYDKAGHVRKKHYITRQQSVSY